MTARLVYVWLRHCLGQQTNKHTHLQTHNHTPKRIDKQRQLPRELSHCPCLAGRLAGWLAGWLACGLSIEGTGPGSIKNKQKTQHFFFAVGGTEKCFFSSGGEQTMLLFFVCATLLPAGQAQLRVVCCLPSPDAHPSVSVSRVGRAVEGDLDRWLRLVKRRFRNGRAVADYARSADADGV